MIRLGRLSDKARAVELFRDSRIGAGFDRSEGPTTFVFPFIEEDAQQLFIDYLSTPRRLCLIHDVGGVAQGILLAHAYKHDFGPVWMAQERLWWVDPDHRGYSATLMLDAYDAWAAAQGCQFVGMAGMGEDPLVSKLYVRRGYVPAERHFLKAI